VTQCEVLAPPVGTLVQPLADLLGALEIRQYVPQIEVAVADNATALVLRVLRAPTEQDRDKLRDFAARHAVRLYLQSGGLDSIAELTSGETDDRTHDGTADGADRDRPRAPLLSYGLPAFNHARVHTNGLRPGERHREPGAGESRARAVASQPGIEGARPLLRARQLHACARQDRRPCRGSGRRVGFGGACAPQCALQRNFQRGVSCG